jgi:hypothetical protein
MLNPGLNFLVVQISGQGAEEVCGCIFLVGGRIRHVDYHVGARQYLGQSVSGGGVVAGRRRGGYGIVAVVGQASHQLGALETGASNDDDSHVDSFQVPMFGRLITRLSVKSRSLGALIFRFSIDTRCETI